MFSFLEYCGQWNWGGRMLDISFINKNNYITLVTTVDIYNLQYIYSQVISTVELRMENNYIIFMPVICKDYLNTHYLRKW